MSFLLHWMLSRWTRQVMSHAARLEAGARQPVPALSSPYLVNDSCQ